MNFKTTLLPACSAVIATVLINPCLGQGSQSGGANEYRSPERFEKDIERFEALDQEEPPPTGGIVCIGSSSMRGWHQTIADDLAPLTIVPRGFGGSNMNDALHYTDRILLPYKPRAVLVYEGENDIAQGIHPEKVAARFVDFVEKIHGQLPDCRVYFISLKPSIARWQLWPEMIEANRLIAELCSKDKRLTFVDVASGMLDSEGKPRQNIFKKDALHLNREGYIIWRNALRPILLESELKFEKQKPDAAASARPLVVAHRGASKDAPENTVPAFELAWQQGADAIEGDFHLTADGEIVCIHDKDTKKVSVTNKVVKQSTLAELRELDVGAWFGADWKGTRIPTIAEVLATIPEGKKIYIEVKTGPEILPKLFEELDASDLEEEQVVIISFNKEVIRSAKQDAPGYKAVLLSSLKMNRGSLTVEPTALDLLKTLKQTGADGLSSKAHPLVDEAYINTILERGLEYHVWTINDLEAARRFSEMGVHSITTKRPVMLVEGLGE